MNLTRIDYSNIIGIRQDVPVPQVLYTGAGDIVTGAIAWWGLRAYSSAARGSNCCRIRRLSDNAEQDFVTLATGAVDRASISAFLASTTGAFVAFYDQSGGARDMTQATSANQAAVNLSGIGSLVTADFTSSSGHRYGAPAFTQAQPFSYVAAAKSTNTGVQQSLLTHSGGSNQLGYRNSADNQVFLYAGSVLSATASDGTFHTLCCVFNGASSAVNVDGSSTSGGGGSDAASSVFWQLGQAGGSQHFNGQWTETGSWGSALSGTQMTDLDTNISAFWGY